MPAKNESKHPHSVSENKLNKINQAKYLVGFSNIKNEGSEFALYNEDGQNLSRKTSKHGINLIMSTQNKYNLYFNSKRSNDFFKINLKSGGIKEFNEKSKSIETENEGSFFKEASDNYVYHDINVGYMDKGYESEFVYWKENSPNKKSHLPLKGMLNSARIIDNKILY